MAVTQHDIAKKLGISQRLVSYALTGHPYVNEEMRARIKQEAERLGYRPSRSARALVTGRTYQITLCFPFLGPSHYNEIIRRFEILARQTPYDLLVCTYDPNGKDGHSPQFTVDGMIFVSPASRLAMHINCPVVVVQNQMTRPVQAHEEVMDRVQIDTANAANAAMDHLWDEGFRRIAYVAPKHMMDPEDFRYSSYLEKMAAAGLPPELITLPIPGEELICQNAHDVLKEHFGEHGFPDAIFCSNDDIGIGAYGALQEMGRRIPHETAVLGFDDFDYAKYLTPPLSSVSMPVQEACRRAWEMLMQRIENASLPPQFERFDAQLVVRKSSLGKSKQAQGL
jgi:DNA-binding LacI/PurR family transcriptional regulator